MRFCQNCGKQLEDNIAFCPNCGAAIEKDVQQGGDNTAYPQQTYQNTYGTGGTAGITEKSIGISLLLTFVTCGIYSIYWMICLNDEVNRLSNEPNATSGGMVFLFSLITCGIYGLFWMYKMGERCDRIKGNVNGSSSVLYLILGFLGLGLVSYCLMQDTINKAPGIR